MIEIQVPYVTCSSCTHPSGPPVKVVDRKVPEEQLRSAYVPSIDERTLICQRVSDVRSDIAVFKEHISRLQDSLNELQAEHDHLERYVNVHEGLMSSVRKLPDELLEEIFWYSLDDGWIRVCTPTFKDVLRLAQVCSRWRTVAFELHALWASLYLDLDYRNAQREEPSWYKVDHRLHFCLKRSGSMALTLSLNSHSTSEVYAASIVKMLVAHSSHWGSWTYYANLPNLAPEFAPLKGRLPVLQEASIRMSGFDLELFEGAPCLSRLTLSPTPSLVKRLPYALLPHVTHFVLGGRASPFEIFNIVQGMPNLEHFTWRGFVESSMNGAQRDMPQMAMTLPHLRSLKFTCNSLIDATIFIALTLPALVDLDVSARITDSYEHQVLVNEIFTFLQRSCCTLGTLSLHKFPARSVSKIIGSASTIETLALSKISDAQMLMHSLTQLCILPRMHRLRLRGCSVGAPDIMELIKSRGAELQPSRQAFGVSNVVPLQFLAVHFADHDCPDDIQLMQLEQVAIEHGIHPTFSVPYREA